MINGILVTHGHIGEAIIEAVKGIIGTGEGLYSLNVMNMSVEEIHHRILALVNAPEEKDEGVIIMASLKGGSCWNVSAAIARMHHNVRLVSGVNLPMVLSFVTKRSVLPLTELAAQIKKDGEQGISSFN